MRGRLYPQPRQRYERFRLNPYSPLYEGLVVFISASLVQEIPELHGPYALPGGTVFGIPRCPFFPEIGRAAFTSMATSWATETVPPPGVITLTMMLRVSGPVGGGIFIRTANVHLLEYNNETCPRYGWVYGQGYSEGKFWPLNTWFTFSATFRPGSVRGYLSNWGIIDVELLSGEWITGIHRSGYVQILIGTGTTFAADTFVHLRELSLTELDAISDYGNVDLRVPDGAPLILPVRTYWPSVLPVAPSYLKRRSLGARVGTREAAL